MSFKSVVGLDKLDVLIQVALTAIIVAGFLPSLHGEDEVAVASMMITGTSLLVFAVRRHIALRRLARGSGVTTGEMNAERMAELESRVAELESAQARVYELEERLDFTERLLAREADVRKLPAAEARQP